MRIRQHIEHAPVDNGVTSTENRIADIVEYFTRQSDKELLKVAIETAYSSGIGSLPAGEDSVETYSNGNFRTKLENGEIDALNVGWGHKVANAKASMFTEPGLRFSLVHDTDVDLTDVEEMLQRHRKKGGFIATNVSTNRVAVFLGSCLVMVSYLRGNLRYKKIFPHMLRVTWGETVVENGIERPVDRLDIEDCSSVLIRLGQTDIEKYSYLGIIPSTEAHPYGRYVTFTESLACSEIPEENQPGVVDYRLSGEDGKAGIAVNPLSWYAAQNPDRDIPEIPLAVMLGGTTEADVLAPTFETLYEQSITFDKKTSHILDKVDQKAAGTVAVMSTHEGAGKSLPRRTTGEVALQPGQSIEPIAHDATACQIAHEINRADMIDTAASYAVPDFMVISEDHTVDASSGRALEIKAQPLKKDRKNIIDLNGPYVDRLFEIEKATLGFKAEEDEKLLSLLAECRQDWEAGSLVLPQDKKEVSERIIALGNAGVIDTIAQIREYYQLPSDEEAKERYREMQERHDEFPPLNQVDKDREQEKQGLFRGFDRSKGK